MRAIYETACEVFKQEAPLFEEYGLQPLEFINLYDGQYVTYKPTAHPMPALFLGWATEWRPMLNNTQEGTITVDAYLVLENYSDASSISEDQDLALMVFNYQTVVNLILHGMTGEEFTPLVRNSERSLESGESNVKVYLLSYAATVTEKITKRDRKYLKAPLDDVQLNRIGKKEPTASPTVYVI